jgi:TonB family protein
MPPETKSEAAPQEQAAIQLFTAPRPKNIDMVGFPTSEIGQEGWVELAFMVDTHGKPFEVTVIRSTGNPNFDKLAVQSMEHSRFVPGKLNGQPVESGSEMKYIFANPHGGPPGANRDFIRAYKTLTAAVDSGDRAAADEAMQKLKISNLYEDAFFGIATYQYAAKFGDEHQQLEGLRRAIAREAVATGKRLAKARIDKETATRVRSTLGKLEKMRTDDSAYAVAGQISEKNWYLRLFKRHFQAEVSEGYISEVRLRCDTRHWFFPFDSTLQYAVTSKDGDCSIELLGAPGTQFKLIQF